MIDDDSQNPPFARSKRAQDLADALVNQEGDKKRGTGETEQINRESNLAGRFHCVRHKFERAQEDAPTIGKANFPAYP